MTTDLPLQKIRTEMRGLAGMMRLPFRHRTWRGQTGQMLGTGTGSSLDFQDHRPYFPGDDPRGINWQAFARTGVYTMKLYRDEVSPRLDLVMDATPSMSVDPAKKLCSLRLLYFALESALMSGASIRLHLLAESAVRVIQPEEYEGIELSSTAQDGTSRPKHVSPVTRPPRLEQIVFRPGSLRVWISDLLFESAPETLLPLLLGGRGRALLFCPFSREESQPGWAGNTEFIDIESGARRHQNVDAGLLENYSRAYSRHFEMWKLHARKLGIALTRVCAENDLRDELLKNALPQGAVELWT